ncbi:MAG: HAMP domain-containing protein [Gammaproteobacteria bacterium]|nr:HAMP domain-containing protein [Gammaproteobacteria bacterium]
MRLARFRDLPIGRKLVIIVLPISGFGLMLALLAVSVHSGYNLRRDIERQTASLAQVVGDNTAGALSFGDAPGAARTLAGLAAIPSIRRACLYATGADLGAGLLAAYPADAAESCPSWPLQERAPSGRNTLEVLAPVVVAGEPIGRLYLERDLGELRRQLWVQAGAGLLVFALALSVIAVLLRIMQSRLVAPIQELAQTAGEIRRTRDYRLRAAGEGQDEVGSLVAAFNAMLDDMQAAQRQLVESEKMAALGGLVAGVAHEVNTPIGIGVTAASHLQQEVLALEDGYRGNALGREQLERFLGIGKEGTQLLMTHLERAADLIASFKQVAVDQGADATREFDLAEYLREVALSLTPKFKKTPHELRVEADGPIPVDSYPGAIAQIVTNLVINSLIHGFDGGRRGTVVVSAAQDGDDARIEVRDDGRGIPEAHHKRLFQPFFTTRRNAGGTGLGLHVVYNLVTQKLHGRIGFESAEGRGAAFTIIFPKRVQAP